MYYGSYKNKMNLINCIIVLILTTFTIATAPPIDVVFIIQNQDTNYQHELSRNLKRNIIKQSEELQPKYRIKVHLLHEIFNYPGGWTIHNLIPQLMLPQRKSHTSTNINMKIRTTTETNKHIDMEIINDNTRWVVFCEENTNVKVKLLMERLNHENHTQPVYLGHALYDREPTIIHHFAFFENPKWFPYPMLRAGVVFSMPLLKCIADIYTNQHKDQHLQQHSTLLQRSDFSIDAAHELARFIYDNVQNLKEDIYKTSDNVNTRKQKVILKKVSYICPTATWETENMNNERSNNYIKSSKANKYYGDESCAMYAEQTNEAASSTTCNAVRSEEVYFAVKTCSKYHNERLSIIRTTWVPYAKHVKYFSDFQDDTIPTTNTGVPNVEIGHCAKTLQILKLALRDIENYNKLQHHQYINQAKQGNNQIHWLFLTDDDTLLSVSGVCQVLGCYNSMDKIYLGERYGYRLYAQDGFNYITGGGGIAFSLPVVKLILQHCSCPSPTAPDDMILGSCLHSLQLKGLHSSRFHQARPNDYPLELLKQEPPISFHKFWQLDPIDVYNQWFAAQDRQLLTKGIVVQENLIDVNYRSKTRKMAKTEPLNLDEIPASLLASLHHSKERHVDL